MKIYLAYHKKTPLIQNNILTPIHAGKALSKTSLNMIGDDTGENISDRNPYWCELTVMYWMWKNVNTDYYGLFHYRRIYDFCNTKKSYFDSSTNVVEQYGLTEDNLKKECEGYDAIMPPLWNVQLTRDENKIVSIYDFYAADHIENDLKVSLEVINEKYPEYSETAALVMNRRKAYYCNMFIMKKELFHRYSSWLFDILFEVEKRINIKLDDSYQCRVFGFLSERLINIFIFHQQCHNPSFKLKEVSNMPMGIFDGKYPLGTKFNDKANWENALNYAITPYKKMVLPLVSVIVPVYNVQKYLPACLNSLVGQSLENIEIIIVNDGSTDDSQNIINTYANIDKRIISIQQENRGLSAARNKGLEHASGKYVFFVDGDDCLKLPALKKLTEHAEKTYSQVVCCTTEVIDADSEITIDMPYYNETHLPQDIINRVFSIKDIIPYLFNMQVSAWNKLYLRSFLSNIKATFPEGLYFEDNPFFFNVMLYAQSISYLSEHYYLYRTNRSGSILTEQSDKFFDFFAISDICENLLKQNQYWDLLKHYFFEYKIISLVHWYKLIQVSSKTNYLSKLKNAFLSYNFDEQLLKKLNPEVFELYMQIISNNFQLSDEKKSSTQIEIKNNVVLQKHKSRKISKITNNICKHFLGLFRSYRNEVQLEELKKDFRRFRNKIDH